MRQQAFLCSTWLASYTDGRYVDENESTIAELALLHVATRRTNRIT